MKTKNLPKNALFIAIVLLSSVLTTAQVSTIEPTVKIDSTWGIKKILNSEKDTICLDFIPVIGSNEYIRGHVNNVDGSKFRMACFIFVPNYGYINKPMFAYPSVPIDSITGQFKIDYCTGGNDDEATIIWLFLVPKNYIVPLINRASAIPQEVYENSIAFRCIHRDTIPNTTLTLSEDSVCLGDHVTLQATGGSHYFWPVTKDTSSTISFTAKYSGLQNIKVEISDGKGNGVVKSINLFVIGIEFDDSYKSILPADSVILSVKQSVIDNFRNLIWAPGGQTTSSIKVSPNKYIVYTVTGTSNKGGCQLKASATVSILNNLSISYNPDTMIYQGTSVKLTAKGNSGDKILWYNGETTQSINVKPDKTTTYTVEITNDFYEYTRRLSLTIHVSPMVSVITNLIDRPKIYPNPASDFIIIESMENYMVTGSIRTIQGVEIANFTFSGNTKINTSNLNSGCYVVEFLTNERKFQTKLIISK